MQDKITDEEIDQSDKCMEAVQKINKALRPLTPHMRAWALKAAWEHVEAKRLEDADKISDGVKGRP